MVGDAHGAETQEEPQAAQEHGSEQTQKEQPQVNGVDWKAVIEIHRCRQAAATCSSLPP